MNMMSSDFILVCDDENGEPTEVTVENDSTIYLPSIANQFPGTTTLKYRNPQTNAFRLIKCIDDVLYPPAEGWMGVTYITVKPGEEDRKRKRTEGDWMDTKRSMAVGDMGGHGPPSLFSGAMQRGPLMGMGTEGLGIGAITAPPFQPTGVVSTGAPPNEANVAQLLSRSGYNLERGPGERKYGAPPPKWTGNPPGDGCEVYVGNLPMDMYEDSLVPMFEQFGRIYEMRLKMDPNSGLGRGFCFVVYSCKDEAIRCVKQMKWYEIAPEQFLKVNIQINNCRLFIGNIPKDKEREEISEKFGSIVKYMTDTIVYTTPGSNQANRGFCFLDFESHKSASDAKRKLLTTQVWNRDLVVSWADTKEEPDEKKMENVKTLYVKNLTEAVTEDLLKESFEQFGALEKVKKVRDFAFVCFEERAHCLAAMETMNGEYMEGAELQITLAKPADRNERNRLQQRKEERKMMFRGRGGRAFPYAGMNMRGGFGGGRGGSLRGGGFGGRGGGGYGGRGRGYGGGRGFGAF